MHFSILIRCVLSIGLASVFACNDDGSPSAPTPNEALPALSAVADVADGGRIADSDGREVLLRGVNVNAFVEYWQYDEDLFTVYPFTEEDADLIAAMGWNLVRMLLSWSRIEPSPGDYDDAYLDEAAEAVALLRDRGIYTLIDLHQDAWGPSLAAPPDETCASGTRPAGGWDGAPGWATFDGGQPRCEAGQRELVPAVQAAWRAFLDDRDGPGGVGIRTRYVQMFAHVVSHFADDDAVLGYDVMNEPNVFAAGDEQILSAFYEDALEAMRDAEMAIGAPKRLFFFEPSIAWHGVGLPAPPPFDHDGQVVYAPHIYQGGINAGTLEEGFARAAEDAAELYGGSPVVTGEWGSDPSRAKDPEDDYFERHLSEQERHGFGAALWTWREACGDPHKYADSRDGGIPEVWGFFDVDCQTNTIDGPRTALTEVLRKMALRFAPGPVRTVAWSLDDTQLAAEGDDARSGNRLEVFVPTDDPASVQIDADGFGRVDSVPWFGGTLFYADATGGPWSARFTR